MDITYNIATTDDNELRAIEVIILALRELDVPTRYRILQYVIAREATKPDVGRAPETDVSEESEVG